VADSPSFNWLLEPTFDQRELVNATVADLAKEFVSVFECTESTDQALISFPEGDFTITLGVDNKENQLSPSTLKGAGEVVSCHGRYPLLFFATLKKLLSVSLPLDSGFPLTFCDQVGEEVNLDDMAQLDAEIRRMGLDPGDFRDEAELIGFVEKLYKLDQLSPSEPSMFF
jgi:hypothetical protein